MDKIYVCVCSGSNGSPASISQINPKRRFPGLRPMMTENRYVQLQRRSIAFLSYGLGQSILHSLVMHSATGRILQRANCFQQMRGMSRNMNEVGFAWCVEALIQRRGQNVAASATLFCTWWLRLWFFLCQRGGPSQ